MGSSLPKQKTPPPHLSNISFVCVVLTRTSQAQGQTRACTTEQIASWAKICCTDKMIGGKYPTVDEYLDMNKCLGERRRMKGAGCTINI